MIFACQPRSARKRAGGEDAEGAKIPNQGPDEQDRTRNVWIGAMLRRRTGESRSVGTRTLNTRLAAFRHS